MLRTFLALGFAAVAALAAPPARVLVVDVNGVVHPITAEILQQAVEQARESEARLLLIRLNTPGGFAEATRRCIEILVASPVPVVTYVTPSGGRAASAGFFLLQAGDVAAMAPATNTGAATPVMLGGKPDETMIKKITSDSAASLRSLVDRRGRNVKLAEETILESKSFTEKEALDGRLIETVAADEHALMEWLHGRQIHRFSGKTETLDLPEPELLTYERTMRQKVQQALSDPNLSLALAALGFLGLYIEFTAPGLIFPGVAGGILLLLGLSGLSVLPITWTGAALLLLAIALFVIETQVPSHGILSAGGALAMVLGSLLLIDSPIPEMRVRLSTALGLALPFALIAGFLVTLVVRARNRPATTGNEGMIGLTAVALTDLSPRGRILAHGEIWEAISTTPVPADASVRVIAIEGLLLKVEPVQAQKELPHA